MNFDSVQWLPVIQRGIYLHLSISVLLKTPILYVADFGSFGEYWWSYQSREIPSFRMSEIGTWLSKITIRTYLSWLQNPILDFKVLVKVCLCIFIFFRFSKCSPDYRWRTLKQSQNGSSPSGQNLQDAFYNYKWWYFECYYCLRTQP